jgi:hypothetical protein
LRTHQENEAKENAPVPRILRVVAAVGASGNSPAVGGLRQSARLFPSASSMLGAGQRELKKHTFKKLFSSPLQGAT